MKSLIAVLTVLIFAKPVLAESTFPNIGADNCKGKKQVVQPGSSSPLYDRNGGFLTDSQCSTVFVLPPRTGDLKITAAAVNQAIEFCSSLDSDFESYQTIKQGVREAERRMIKAMEEGQDDQAKEQMINAKLMRGYQKDVVDSLRELSSAEGFTAQSVFQTDWDQVVQAYQTLNPDKVVKKMPLVGSYLTATLKSEQDSIMDAISGGMSMSALRSFKIPGIRFADKVLSENHFSYLEVPEEFGGFSFNGSLSGQLVLNLAGACPFVAELVKLAEAEPDQRKAISIQDLNRSLAEGSIYKNLGAYMVSNLTYFYPVQYVSGYRLKVDVTASAEVLQKRFKEKSTVHSVDILNETRKLSQQGSIEFEYITPLENGLEPQAIEDLKNRVLDSIGYQLLNRFGTLVDKVPNLEGPEVPTDPHILREQWVQKCRTSGGFLGIGRSTRCWNEVYKVKVPVTGWAKAISEYLATITVNTSTKTDIFHTLVMNGTLAFVADHNYMQLPRSNETKKENQ